MSRPTEARIDLAALRRNYLLARQLYGGRALADMSADACGHGALRCAQALRQLADGYAVGSLDEALALRELGIRAPILLLEGLFAPDELPACAREQLWIVVHQGRQIDWIEQSLPGQGPWQIWLRLADSGQGPGFAPHELGVALERLRASRRVSEPVMSHPDDWARPGSMLYGIAPEGYAGAALTPVMTLCAAIIAVRWVAPGTAVSGGDAGVTTRRTRVGWLALGHADGYPHSPGPRACVLAGGRPIPLLGKPALHTLALDLTDHPDLGIDSIVEAWGPRLPVESVALASGATAEALLCGVRGVRRVYHAPQP